MKHDRAPRASILASFANGLRLALWWPRQVIVAGEPLPLAPHLEPGDVVAPDSAQSLGLTLRRNADGTLSTSAHETYAKRACEAGLMWRWSAAETTCVGEVLSVYLAGAEVGARWLRRERGVPLGQVGLDAVADAAFPWVAVDREVVLAHASAGRQVAARSVDDLVSAETLALMFEFLEVWRRIGEGEVFGDLATLARPDLPVPSGISAEAVAEQRRAVRPS